MKVRSAVVITISNDIIILSLTLVLILLSCSTGGSSRRAQLHEWVYASFATYFSATVCIYVLSFYLSSYISHVCTGGSGTSLLTVETEISVKYFNTYSGMVYYWSAASTISAMSISVCMNNAVEEFELAKTAFGKYGKLTSLRQTHIITTVKL
jgi:hypothetical protein